MRIGVSLNIHGSQTATGPGYTQAMRTAEQVAFDGIWFFDALGRGTFRVDPVSGMAAAAAVTEKIELGTCILQVTLRGTVELGIQADQEAVLEAARQQQKVAEYLEGKTVRREIFVPGRLVNFVVV